MISLCSPYRPRTFEPHLHDALEDALDLLEQHERGQMDEYRGAQPRARVRGARGEITDVLGERVLERRIEAIIGRIRQTPRLGQLEARGQGLDAEMILLVDHDADAVVGRHVDAARARPVAQLVRDEMTLDQHLPFDRRALLHLEQQAAREARRGLHRTLHTRQHAEQLLVLGAMRERHITQIARQPDARGQHHVRMRTGTAQPRRGCREQTGEVGGCAHDGSPDTAARASDSRRRISSRIWAARSKSSRSTARCNSS
jgi:hypothetical protein